MKNRVFLKEVKETKEGFVCTDRDISALEEGICVLWYDKGFRYRYVKLKEVRKK